VSAASDVKIPKRLHSRYDELFLDAGSKYGVSPVLLAAVAKQESGFNPTVKSHAGAEGLMQFMPGTARQYKVNTMDPASSVDGGARFLRALLDRYDGNIDLALSGYNAGTNAVDKYGGIPPYPETRNYVKSIKAMYRNGK
jgi:soluble lytic murein transglycosylase-like protein